MMPHIIPLFSSNNTALLGVRCQMYNNLTLHAMLANGIAALQSCRLKVVAGKAGLHLVGPKRRLTHEVAQGGFATGAPPRKAAPPQRRQLKHAAVDNSHALQSAGSHVEE